MQTFIKDGVFSSLGDLEMYLNQKGGIYDLIYISLQYRKELGVEEWDLNDVIRWWNERSSKEIDDDIIPEHLKH